MISTSLLIVVSISAVEEKAIVCMPRGILLFTVGNDCNFCLISRPNTHNHRLKNNMIVNGTKENVIEMSFCFTLTSYKK